MFHYSHTLLSPLQGLAHTHACTHFLSFASLSFILSVFIKSLQSLFLFHSCCCFSDECLLGEQTHLRVLFFLSFFLSKFLNVHLHIKHIFLGSKFMTLVVAGAVFYHIYICLFPIYNIILMVPFVFINVNLHVSYFIWILYFIEFK